MSTDAELPVPPLRLARILLHGVGPEGARFDPLDLDFRTEAGAASRVLLSLTNTGGKSTLITLVSSLIVPAARAQVGRKNLGDYVLTGDTSHVVCEWEDTTDGTRTVTGTVMEWRDGRRQPAHAQRTTTAMHRAWYLLRTGDGLPGIDDLPFVADGKRVTFERFCSAVGDLVDANPGTQGVLVRAQGEWMRTLDERTSIDPVLFGYQMRMNDSESGAEKLLASFDSDDHVVRFFLSALNDERELSDFTSKLTEYAKIAAERPRLVALADFGTDAEPAVAAVDAAARHARLAQGTAAAKRGAAADHVAALVRRIADDKAKLGPLEDEAERTASEREAAQREYGQVSDIRLQIQLEHARWRHKVAGDELDKATIVAAAAELDAKAWSFVDDVTAVNNARVRLEAARESLAAAHADLEPLRERVRAAAGRLAGRLDTLIAAGHARLSELDDDITSAGTEAEAARADELTRRDEVAALERSLEDIGAAIDAAEAARSRAREDGLAAPGEEPTATQARWQSTAADAHGRAARHQQAAADAEARFDELAKAIHALDERLVGERRAADRARSRADAARDDFAALDTDDVVALAGAAPDDPESAQRVAALATEAASSADERAARHLAVARDAEAEIARLDDTGTAPAGADALAVLDVILGSRIGAVTGLEWVEHNVVGDDRPRFIAERPDIAGGVVVSDPARFADAVAAVDAAELRTRTPVTITATGDPGAGPQHGGDRHVVVPHRATWDRDWAARHRDELEAAAVENQKAATEARHRAEGFRDIAATCRDVARRWAGQHPAQLEGDAADAEAVVAASDDERRVLVDEQAQVRSSAQAEREAADAAEQEAIVADGRVDAAGDLVEICATAAQAQDRRDGVVADRDRAAGELGRARNRAGDASKRRDRLVSERAQTDATTQTLHQERATITEGAVESDDAASVDELRLAWTSLRGELDAAEAGITEAARVRQLEKDVVDAETRIAGLDEELLEAARERSARLEASSVTGRRDAQARAREHAEAANRARAEAEAEVTDTRHALERAAPSSPSHNNHFDLANAPEWRPTADFADVDDVLARLDAHGVTLRDAANQAAAAATQAQTLLDTVRADVESFTDTVSLWRDTPPPAPQAYAGTRDEARDRLRILLDELSTAEAAHGSAREELSDAIADVRAVANDKRWLHLDAAIVLRLRKLSDDHLVAEVETLARQLSAMCASARGDLADLDKHRLILRDGLLVLCRAQRRLLREVSRASRLPAGLGDLSAQPAVKITFEDAPEDEAAGRLAERIDTWAVELAENPKRASSSEQRARWLADAVRDTVVNRTRAGAWSISILKPRIDGHVSYTPPGRISDEFSGGQVLTLAVLVYCALAGVRSAHRVGGARPAGCLILDNPFGAASNEALIAMQHRLAAHTGLQLLCATGIHDAGVDAAFAGRGSVIIKLRNDGDVRRNLSYLRLRSSTVDGVEVEEQLTGGRDRSDERNWVEARRYQVGR